MNPCISHPLLLTQVIPAGGLAGFDVAFTSNVVNADFRQVVSYTINSQHAYSFTIAANVVPIYIQVRMLR